MENKKAEDGVRGNAKSGRWLANLEIHSANTTEW
jgi:hypothetical protein